MNKKLVVILCLLALLLLSSLLFVRPNSVKVKASNGYPVHNLDTGLNYTTIQGAIDAPETLDGHTIFVEEGTYYEHVVVSKSISIIGENRSTTIIDGNGTGTVVYVTENNVLVKSFTIRNSGNKFPNSGVFLNESRSCIVIDNILTNTQYGVLLYPSNSTVVSDNMIANNRWIGILLGFSSNNIVRRNMVINNTQCGICLYSCSSDIIGDNKIVDTKYGIDLHSSSDGMISGNNVTNNDYGIWLDESSNNSIYHNNFLNNTLQVYTYDSVNVWDDGVEGNYWSNYTGVDSNHDGIGDTEHVIDANNTDHFPLMGEFHKYHIWDIGPGFTLALISNSTISNFFVAFWIEHPEYRTIYFDVAGETGYGFCRLCIPKSLMAPPYTVTIDNGQTPVTYYNETLFDNDTHRWIYFAYLHSEHQVEIIPEFPSFLILPLFMIATLLAVIVYKRKHQPRNKKREELG